MQRRSFIGLLSGLIAASTIDPEILVWTPEKKTIFIPPVANGNQFLTMEMITKEALEVLKNNLRFSRFVNREYDLRFSSMPVGTVLNIRNPSIH